MDLALQDVHKRGPQLMEGRVLPWTFRRCKVHCVMLRVMSGPINTGVR